MRTHALRTLQRSTLQQLPCHALTVCLPAAPAPAAATPMWRQVNGLTYCNADGELPAPLQWVNIGEHRCA